MLASDLMKICCRLWFLVSKHVPLIPRTKPKAAKEVAASEGDRFFSGRSVAEAAESFGHSLLHAPVLPFAVVVPKGVPRGSSVWRVFSSPAVSRAFLLGAGLQV